MKAIAIIPARGGSKGIPLKNIRLIAGKPLISYTIEAAKKSRFIECVYVSTDHPEIASIAERFGAIVINRPCEISGDNDSSETAILHALEHIKKSESSIPDICAFLQCTSPLTIAEDIDGTIDKLIAENADSSFSGTLFHYFLWHIDETGNAIGINHDKSHRMLRQNRKDQFQENGALYVFKVQKFLQEKHRFFGKTTVYIMPRERSFEIDDPIDIKIAEVMIRENQNKDLVDSLPKVIDAIVFDFDGVFTNNSVIVDQNGNEAVICDRGDGLGISRIKKYEIPILVLSTEKNKVVNERCKKLNIDCIQGSENKVTDLEKWLKKLNLRIQNTIFVGNDINDEGCLNKAGCSVIVQDAHEDIHKAADIILSKPGGRGAVRELADLIDRKMRIKK